MRRFSLISLLAISFVIGACELLGPSEDGFLDYPGPILFSSGQSGTNQLYSIRPDGSDVRQLTSDPDEPIIDAAWAPDGRSIVLTSVVRGDAAGARFEYLFVVDRSGNNRRRLSRIDSATRYESDSKPVWSPDGKKLAFVKTTGCCEGGRGEVYVVNSDGSGMKKMTGHISANRSVVRDWSNDGSKLLSTTGLVVRDSTGRAHSRNYLTIWNIDGDSLYSYQVKDGSISNAKWSDDEQLIAIDARRYKDIFLGVVNLSSGERTEWPLDEFWQTVPVDWSRDGKKILASAYQHPDPGQHILLIDVATGLYEDISPFSAAVHSWYQNR